MGRPRIYTDEQRIAKKREQSAAWRAKNKEKIAGYYKKDRDAYIEKAAEWKRANPERARELARRRTEERRDEISARRKVYREKNKEKISAGVRAWHEQNKDRKREYSKRYRVENRDKVRASDKNKNTMRQRLIGGQVIARFYADEIREIYRRCPAGHHVDHVIPLKGKNVCGLHIPINLQYLPAKENMSKGGKFDPAQFEEVATLRDAPQGCRT